MTVRVALAQVAWAGDRESTLNRLDAAVREAASSGADLVAFAELCTSPYFCTRPRGRFDEAFESIPDGPTVRRLSALAAEHGVVVLVPLAERDEHGRRYNSAALIDADGSLAGRYRKRHLPQCSGAWERDYFRPGDEAAQVFPTTVGRIGVAICWDRYYDDTWQALERGGARLALVPIASTTEPSLPDPTTDLAAFSFPDSMVIATVNRVGHDGYSADPYSGRSYILTRDGRLLRSPGDLSIHEVELGGQR